MPELPEVETVRRTLKNMILNKVIKSVDVYYPNIIKDDINYFKAKLKNQKINDIKRSGKFLIFVLDDINLVSHLRMEGKYYYKNKNEELNKHEHVVFKFDDDMELRYHDTRKFGIMILKSNDDLYTTEPLSTLGLEPFYIDYNDFYNKIKNKKKPIKEILLDQTIMSGLGNIYVDEVLFMSKIHPNTLSNKIDLNLAKTIVSNAIIVLNKAISLGGTTIRSYQSSLGVSGKFQNELLVHTKKKCIVCNGDIKKIRVGGRGTYVCMKCQSLL